MESIYRSFVTNFVYKLKQLLENTIDSERNFIIDSVQFNWPAISEASSLFYYFSKKETFSGDLKELFTFISLDLTEADQSSLSTIARHVGSKTDNKKVRTFVNF